jgi:hypothetical protein
VVETVAWHFHESTGCSLWLEFKRKLSLDEKVPAPFEDEWPCGRLVRRWAPEVFWLPGVLNEGGLDTRAIWLIKRPEL